MTTTKNNSDGFTLIELVMVIVILGVLGAVALPRFIGISQEARASTITAGQGAILSTASMVHAKVLVSGTPVDGTVRQVDIGNGDTIDVQNGYPACTANGIVKATGMAQSGKYIWYYCCGNPLCTLYPNLGHASNGDTIYNNNCAVVYDSSTGGTWTPVTSGC